MLTARIVNFTGGHEGFVSTWYLDPVGIPTIGYGFTWASHIFRDWWMKKHGRKMRRGDTITKADAYQVLLAILADEVVDKVDAKLGRVANRILEAGYSAVFNLGPGSLGWKWAAAIARGDLQTGAALWRKMGTTAKGKKLPGLVRRRNEEADIAAFDRWRAWVTEQNTAPEPHVDGVDIQQAQLWLNQLGYECGAADGIPGLRTVEATKRFQKDHGTLKVDGIIGSATLAALQRAVDLKRSGTKVVVGGSATVGAGVTENSTGAVDQVAPAASGIGDWLLWGGLAVTACVLAWLAWRYRDELVAALKKL